MWVIDWNRTSVRPIAFRSRLAPPVDDATKASSPSHASGRTWARTPDIVTVPAVADKGFPRLSGAAIRDHRAAARIGR
jgi:hypothetical protein